MKQLTATCSAFMALCPVLALPALADKFRGGADAFERSGYVTERPQFEPLTEQGHSTAHNDLGSMYANGEGGPKDLVMGLKWLMLSRENGYAKAGRVAERGEKLSTPTEIEPVRRFAALWKEKNVIKHIRISRVY